MASQWDNFLQNLGTWRGSFTSLDGSGQEQDSTPSILSLEASSAEERLVHFRLRRFADAACQGEPIHDLQQDYRSLGKQVVFFGTGTFCKGSLQVAPGSAFGAEFGFIHADRRHRLVQLHHDDGSFNRLVLIREFRDGTGATEEPPLSGNALQGHWSGELSTISADWPEPEHGSCSFEINGSGSTLQIQDSFSRGTPPQSSAEDALTLMADGGYHLSPRSVSHRSAFRVEAGWLVGPHRLERLIRCYDRSGAWLSATQIIATRQ